jgi:hypothetical protein
VFDLKQQAMGVLSLKWGAGLIAFSPLTMLFLQIVFKQPELIVISILRSVNPHVPALYML